MSKGKKLFNSEDFDKKKPLFGSEDFDKPIVIGASNGTDSKPQSPTDGKPNKRTIIGALAVVAVVVVVGVFTFGNKGKDNNAVKPSTENVVKTEEKQKTNNDTTVAEPQNKDSHVGAVSTNKSTQNAVTSSEEDAEESANSVAGQPSESKESMSGDVELNARRVIRGDFGNGQVRKDKLGVSYSEIQSKVNEMYRQGLVH